VDAQRTTQAADNPGRREAPIEACTGASGVGAERELRMSRLRIGLGGAMRLPCPKLVAGLATALALAACTTSGESGPSAAVASAVTERPANIPSEALIGRWGVASFRQEKDRQRVEAQARAQCKLPYTIAKGPTGGVMMHVADDPKLYELRLKGGSDGKTYLGFEAPPGDLQDREIVSINDREIVMRFVDPDANNRYGTFVYVKCVA
jgi:hypothetical protein